MDILRRCSGVVVARCSPTQKARVARLLRARKHVVAAVGDGGNDVAMIQEADMGECTRCGCYEPGNTVASVTIA